MLREKAACVQENGAFVASSPDLDQYLRSFDAPTRELAIRQCWALTQGAGLDFTSPEWQDLLGRIEQPEERAAFALLALQSIAADPSTAYPTATRSGEQPIVQDDYLVRLAKALYGDESFWPVLYAANPQLGPNPDLIHMEDGPLHAPSFRSAAMFMLALKTGRLHWTAEGIRGQFPPGILSAELFLPDGRHLWAGGPAVFDADLLTPEAQSAARDSYLSGVDTVTQEAALQAEALLREKRPLDLSDTRVQRLQTLMGRQFGLFEQLVEATRSPRSPFTSPLLGATYRLSGSETVEDVAEWAYGSRDYAVMIKYYEGDESVRDRSLQPPGLQGDPWMRNPD